MNKMCPTVLTRAEYPDYRSSSIHLFGLRRRRGIVVRRRIRWIGGGSYRGSAEYWGSDILGEVLLNEVCGSILGWSGKIRGKGV